MKFLNNSLFLLAISLASLFGMQSLVADEAENAFKQAMLYYNQQDFVAAKKWYDFAAIQKHAEAQYYLGIMYDRGLGVSQDFIKAVRWIRLAASRGLVQAQRHLGTM